MADAGPVLSEQDLKDYQVQLETVLSALEDDPENAELLTLKAELEEILALAAQDVSSSAAPIEPTKPASPSPVKEKWSKENHPAYKAGYKPPEQQQSEQPAQPVTFNVNDQVQARWKSGDGGFYSARITSVTGSRADPVYTVLFKNYGNTETVRTKDLRPLSFDTKKRKADNISGASTPTAKPVNPSVISAASTVDPSLAQAVKKEPSKVSDGPPRPAKAPRKVKAKNELEAGKSKWQDFAAKTQKKFGKKDSMFRTGEGVNARVGFTGSGHEMRKDPTRTRHIYQQGDNDE